MLNLIALLCLVTWPGAMQAPASSQKIVISPQAVPSPAFRYVLLPPLKDLNTGNAVQHYYRCFSPDAMYYYRQPAFYESIKAWLKTPYEQAARKGLPSSSQLKKTNDLGEDEPVPATREELSTFQQSTFYDEIDKAARRTYAEWDYLASMKEHGMMLQLPDLQGVRLLGEIVQIRARLAVMEGEHDRAIHHLQTGLAMAQHLNQANILVNSLTGIGIARNMTKVIEELIQTPGAPNMYWALTNLPQPLLDLRQAYAGDRLAIEYLVGDPKQLEERILTKEEMNDLVQKKLKQLLRMDGLVTNELSMIVLKEYPRAKTWLLEKGRSAADVEKMTATQAVLLFAMSRYQILADEIAKSFTMPFSERLAFAQGFVEKVKTLRVQQDMSYFLGFHFIAYYPNVWVAAYDVDRDITLLRCIELLRHYAAGHQRKLPASWDEVKDLPIPVDPVTGKRLTYQLVGDHAIITLDAIANSPIARHARQFEIYLK